MMAARTYTDFTFYAKMKIAEGTSAGVVFRAVTSDQGYKFSNEGSTFTFVMRTLNGTQIAQGNYNIVQGTWYYIKVAAAGTTKRVYMSNDGIAYTLVCEETVSNDYTNGYVGLYTNSTCAQFDDVHLMFNPSNLTVTPSDRQAVLTWSMDNLASFSKYYVYRGSISADGTANPYVRIRTVTTPGITDTDGLENGVTYYYMVAAVDTYNYESEYLGPAKSLPYEIVAPDTISGSVTQMDATPLSTVRCEAYKGDVLSAITNTYIDGTYAFVGLTENTTYLVKVLLYEGEKVSVVYRDIKAGTKSNNFTLEIKYELSTITGQIASYKPVVASKISISRLSDYRTRAAMLKPKNGVGYIEICHLKDSGETALRIPVDETGRYEIPNLLPGTYVVKAYNGVTYSQPQTVALKAGQRINVALSFPGLLDGRVVAYPSPGPDPGGFITFKYYSGYVNPESTIKIFNLYGELVRTITNTEITGISEALYNQEYKWNCRTASGDRVASGTYLYIIEVKEPASGGSTKAVNKFAIIK